MADSHVLNVLSAMPVYIQAARKNISVAHIHTDKKKLTNASHGRQLSGEDDVTDLAGARYRPKA
uniref:Uncharacterized protein n=1 Tax=Timema tahoe TaxID=61484 RepID=A0A7R9FK42_9NEOP|nr:unnamed protein product [Timema tahoe]